MQVDSNEIADGKERADSKQRSMSIDSTSGNNILMTNGPIDIMVQSVSRLKQLQVLLPFNISDVGWVAMLIVIFTYFFACMSIQAWQLPLYLFMSVLAIGK